MVTGGAGFIGSHLVERLLQRGDQVTVVDNLSTGRRANLEQAPRPGLEFLDSRVAPAVDRFANDGRRFDEIYHLAAAVGVQLVMDAPIEAIETNILETIALLRFAAEADPATPTLIASSSEVYGKGARSPFAEHDDVLYGPTTIARWSYGMSKAIDEHLAIAHHRRSGLPVVVARFFNTVGPRQVGSYGMVLPRFVAAALADEPLIVHGDGSQTRCFCDVRDVVEALPRLVAEPRCHGAVFNLGSDREITILELAQTVIKTLDSRSKVTLLPYLDAFPEGFEDLPRRRPDLARVRQTIGFAPRRPLEETIRDVAAALLADQAREVRA
ncbi:MAG: GDP-mannose 4,6-dehydratase [Phycisphaerales bacterium]|nr:GDP-mannose 4,6-dehydratase [Phycisphaerales bacterium]